MADSEVTSTAPLGDIQQILTTAPIDKGDEIAYEAQAGGTKKPGKPEEAAIVLIRDELKPIFKQLFSSSGIVAWDVPITIASDSKRWEEVIVRERFLQGESLLKLYLVYACDIFLMMLRTYWESNEGLLGKKFPKELQDCKNITMESLPRHFREKYLVPGPLDQDIIKLSAWRILGFYSLQDKRIYLQSPTADIGLIAHEMAHAYTHKIWRDILLLLKVFDVKTTWSLNEGMTYFIGGLIVEASGKTSDYFLSVPTEWIDFGKKFAEAAGYDAAFAAYFGGSITFDPNTPDKRPKFVPGIKGKSWPDFAWK
jgi:hypothetical protein